MTGEKEETEGGRREAEAELEEDERRLLSSESSMKRRVSAETTQNRDGTESTRERLQYFHGDVRHGSRREDGP